MLSMPVIAGIMLGQVQHWQHPSIVELNPTLPLPNLPILVVVPTARSELVSQVRSTTNWAGLHRLGGICLGASSWFLLAAPYFKRGPSGDDVAYSHGASHYPAVGVTGRFFASMYNWS